MNRQPKNKKKSQHSIINEAIDSFRAEVTDIGTSYQALKSKIEHLDVQMSKQNKELEESLFEVNRLKHFLDSILNSMTEGVVVIDTSGNIVLFNESMEKLTGFMGEDVLGKQYVDVFSKNVSQRFSPLHTLKTGESLTGEEKFLTIKGGQSIPVRYNTARVITKNQHVLGVVEVISDLTRLKRFDKAMQQMKTQSALNQMAKLVAHEIRTPLGGIRGYVDLLSESMKEDKENQEKLDNIIQSVNRLNNTVAKFQQFARPIKPHFEQIDIVEFMHELITFFKTNHDLKSQEIRLLFTLPSDWKCHNIRIDPILLEQSILSILENAVQAMPKGGTLHIELQDQMNMLGKNNGFLSIIISDTGGGMDQDILDQLFTPFFTTREQGLGLSLAAVKNFITLHQGEVTIESEKNKGTTVFIIIPSN